LVRALYDISYENDVRGKPVCLHGTGLEENLFFYRKTDKDFRFAESATGGTHFEEVIGDQRIKSPCIRAYIRLEQVPFQLHNDRFDVFHWLIA